MASSSAPVHPYRYLTLFLVLLIGAYLLVFLTGDKQAKPKLGIDLQGGTRVTLTARTPDGSKPTREALLQAQDIISARVNGLGVSGSEVVIDGDNLVITVPGNDSSEARNLGQTARLYIRPVVRAIPGAGAGIPAGSGAAGSGCRRVSCRRARCRRVSCRRVDARPASPGMGVPGIAPLEPEAPVAPPTPANRRSGRRARSTRLAPQPRPFPEEPPPPPPPGPTSTPAPPPGPSPSPAPPTPDTKADLAQRIADEKSLRQNTDRAFSAWCCSCRPPAATKRTCWQATTIPTCRS